VAFELAIHRGGDGVKPQNIARVLYPVAQQRVARWSLPRSQGRRSRPSPRRRASGASRGSRSRSTKGSDDDPGPPELDITPLCPRCVGPSVLVRRLYFCPSCWAEAVLLLERAA
jgi:hypothetical protein